MLVTSCTEIAVLRPIFQNTFILGRHKLANFADIIKSATMIIKKTFNTQRKFRELDLWIEMLSISVLLIEEKILISSETMLM